MNLFVDTGIDGLSTTNAADGLGRDFFSVEDINGLLVDRRAILQAMAKASSEGDLTRVSVLDELYEELTEVIHSVVDSCPPDFLPLIIDE